MCACLFIVSCGAVVQRSGMKSSGSSKDVSTTSNFVRSSTRESVNNRTSANGQILESWSMTYVWKWQRKVLNM